MLAEQEVNFQKMNSCKAADADSRKNKKMLTEHPRIKSKQP